MKKLTAVYTVAEDQVEHTLTVAVKSLVKNGFLNITIHITDSLLNTKTITLKYN